MVVQPPEIAARLAVIKALARIGQFEDDGRPMSEAEYRHSFKLLTYGCADKDIAQFWYANVKYGSPAFFWYHELMSTVEGQTAAKKWSTLESLIEDRWNTPPIDLKAFNQRTRREWADRKFVIEDMLDQLRDPGAAVQPHSAWAAQHRVLGKRVNSSNEDRVASTLKLLPRYVVNLLPKADQYEDDFDGLISDIGTLVPSRLVHAYSTWSALELIQYHEARAHFQPPHIKPKCKPPTLQFRSPTSEPANMSAWDCHELSIAQLPQQIPTSPPSTIAPTPMSPSAYKPAIDHFPSKGQAREPEYERGEHGQKREENARKVARPRRGEVDLSGVEGMEAMQWPMKMQVSIVKGDSRVGPKIWGTIDGGAMLCVLDSVLWAQVEHFVGKLRPSQVVCRMANGARTPSMGTAEVEIEYGEHRWPIVFEVFDSRGAFELLIGKDWLNSTGARQDYLTDTISLCSAGQTIYIGNENPSHPVATPAVPPQLMQPKPTERVAEPKPVQPMPTESDQAPKEPKPQVPVNQEPPRRESRAAGEPPRRSERIRNKARQARDLFWVANEQLAQMERAKGRLVDRDKPKDTNTLEESWECVRQEAEESRQREILAVEVEEPRRWTNPLQEAVERARRARERRQELDDIHFIDAPPRAPVKPIPQPEPLESERTHDPFNPGRVAEIVGKIQIGDDLSAEQKSRVKGLVSEFADIFALKLSEVLPVSITEMKLDIPEGMTFPKRAGQRRMSKPQEQALYTMLDELEAAQVIKRVTQDQIAAVSPINMVPKPSSASRPTLRMLQQMVNSECRKYGVQIKHPEAGFYEGERNPIEQPAKWRLVQNFAAVNKVTQVRPFPMGDLVAKQRAVAGHRYVSVMDFHAGFHAIPIAPESVPYTGFYVDGRGYYVYLRMPFGLTGAPTVFCEMVASALSDLIGRLLEIWMDDMATAADDFETGLSNLRTIFERCRTHKLSLSAAKTVLFMSEAIFAGARVSREGIRPDLAKVKAILKWPEPRTVLEVMSFMGLVNAYRSKIKNFARIAQPLSDLTRDVQPDKESKRKLSYKRALQDTRVTLDNQARQAFVKLKMALTTDPVLKSPVYDGRPFVLTTDGSKAGFGAVLSQVWEEADSKGITRKVTYPVAFASKRTSRSEEKYPPFLLEFAALKFACDEFNNLVFGQPIEIETDCKALADLLGNDKLNSTHERWRESIIARNIIAVRHKPGIENTAPDALSRTYERRMNDEDGTGRDWDVDPGWEARTALVNDLYYLTSDDTAKPLLDRFAKDPLFSDIILYLLYDAGVESKNDEDERNRRRMAHKAEGYTIEDGKLWLVGGKHSRGSSKVECIPQNEGLELAHSVHSAGGHFGRDLTVLALQQEYHWPRLRRDATEAVTTCPKCRNFGPRLMSALLKPITRARPFDLLVADYVAFSEGHGGLKNVLILIDVYSRFMFAFPTSKPGTGKFTVKCLSTIGEHVMTPSSFMADGGSHFDCAEVKQWAADRDVQLIKTPPYAPWTNGLAEGGVKLLAGRLKRLCAPNLGISTDEEADPRASPRSWPLHLTEAVNQLNDRVIPSLGYTPRELLTGMLAPERKAEIGQSVRSPSPPRDVDINLALTYALRSDAFANILEHANRRKRTFDKKVKPIEYKLGSVVQKYDSRLDETHNAVRKLAGRWSGAVRIAEKLGNSYRLEDLEGNPFAAAVHARLLRPFTPKAGTPLATYVEKLRQAHASGSPSPEPSPALPVPVRPEDKLPLPREDTTQPNNYQEDNDNDSISS